MPALADDLTGTVENDAADGGVGRGDADATARKLEGAAHPVEVEVGGGAGWSVHVRARGTIKCTCRKVSDFSDVNYTPKNLLTYV